MSKVIDCWPNGRPTVPNVCSCYSNKITGTAAPDMPSERQEPGQRVKCRQVRLKEPHGMHMPQPGRLWESLLLKQPGPQGMPLQRHIWRIIPWEGPFMLCGPLKKMAAP